MAARPTAEKTAAGPLTAARRFSSRQGTAATLGDAIFSSRLLFVMGKGGVGKTTTSIALALAAARAGKKTLLAEAGDAQGIGRFFQDSVLTEYPLELAPNIWGARINPRAELEAYVRTHVGPKFIANKIIGSRLFDYLFEAAPGLKEVMSLGRLWRWETNAENLPNAAFDLVIVDAPATGHALSLLRLPDMLINMIRIGPVANQIRKLEGLIKNPQKTRLVLVTLPEELPVNETMEIYGAAEQRLGMPVAATVVNGVYPEIFSPAEESQVMALEKSSPDSLDAREQGLIASAADLIRGRRSQRRQIMTIAAGVPGPIWEIPYCFTSDLSLEDIRGLSDFNQFPTRAGL